jgi:hypothetical protein
VGGQEAEVGAGCEVSVFGCVHLSRELQSRGIKG